MVNNNRAHKYQGTRVEPTEQHIAVLATKMQGQPQSNVFVFPTPGASLESRHLIKGPTRDICYNSFASEIGRLAQRVGTRITSGTNKIFFIPKEKVTSGRTYHKGFVYIEIQKDVYGLPRPGKISNDKMKLHLAKF